MTPLCNLAQKHGTNKADDGYTHIYYFLLKDHPPKRILEVGIGWPGESAGASKHGASLYMWEEFFPDAKIYGIDNKPYTMINKGRIQSFLADVEHPTSLVAAAIEAGGNFDFIIDDAVHLTDVQISVATALLPFLSKNGVYVIEDIHAGVDAEAMRQRIPPQYHAAWIKCARGETIMVIRHREDR